MQHMLVLPARPFSRYRACGSMQGKLNVREARRFLEEGIIGISLARSNSGVYWMLALHVQATLRQISR